MTLRRLIAVFISLMLCWTTVACGSSTPTSSQSNTSNTAAVNQVSSGRYPVQQASYNDAEGEYSLMLLNTPAGTPPLFRTTNLQMARLTDEEIKAGETTYAEVNGDAAVMHLSEDFKIEYVHNVTETRTNPQTGQAETVIVRRESNFWAPFAGALAGQALGSLLFTPHYYFPPAYQPGGILTGYGGYGRTYDRAVESYQSRYNSKPAAVTNRQTLRTTGRLRTTPTSSTPRKTTRPKSTSSSRSTGSGFGSQNLRPSGSSSSTSRKSKSPSRFGSSRSPSRSSGGFRSRRR